MSVAEILVDLFPQGTQHCLLITIGNSLRSDDGVGPYLAKRLENIPCLQIEDVGDRPERAIDLVQQYRPQRVVFIDAADFGAVVGAMRRIESAEIVTRSLSTHRLPLPAIIDWIAQEYAVSCQCLVIQAGAMQLGEGLSSAVVETAEKMVSWFRDLPQDQPFSALD